MAFMGLRKDVFCLLEESFQLSRTTLRGKSWWNWITVWSDVVWGKGEHFISGKDVKVLKKGGWGCDFLRVSRIPPAIHGGGGGRKVSTSHKSQLGRVPPSTLILGGSTSSQAVWGSPTFGVEMANFSKDLCGRKPFIMESGNKFLDEKVSLVFSKSRSPESNELPEAWKTRPSDNFPTPFGDSIFGGGTKTARSRLKTKQMSLVLFVHS